MQLAKNKYEWRDDIEWKVVEFVFTTRDIGANTIFDIFNGNTTTLTPTTLAPFYVTSSPTSNYNNFIQGLFVNPKMIRRITISSDTADYLNNPLNILKFNVFGQVVKKDKFVNTYLNSDQVQSFINVDFAPNEFILDNTQYISQYSFPASSSVSFLIYYAEFKRLNMMTAPAEQLIPMKMAEANVVAATQSEMDLRSDNGIFLTLDEILKLKK